ncbi:MAG TPA: carboxypeptidase-like regulatory domain-containing protein [Planctomycetota bacterium]
MRLRPTQIALLSVGLLALSLAGVPFLLRTPGAGALHGVVVDARGFGVVDASVYLFDEGALRLVEETRSDPDGDFEFHLPVTGARVLVQPAEASGLLPAWSASGAEAESRLAFVLHPARELVVRVRDERGAPLPLAEVRVYEEREEVAVLACVRTDGEGRARLPAPGRAHVAVRAPSEPYLMRWRFELEVPAGGTRLELRVPDSVPLSGVVRGPEGPLAGVVLVSWEEGEPEGWNGFTRSDAAGRFTLARTRGATLLRALDPSGAHLPARLRLAPGTGEPLALALEPGAPQVVRTTRNGLPLEAFVWSWSPTVEVWSWGARSGPGGRATVPVGERFSIHAEPLDPALAPMEAWDLPYRLETLRLEATPRR